MQSNKRLRRKDLRQRPWVTPPLAGARQSLRPLDLLLENLRGSPDHGGSLAEVEQEAASLLRALS
jgi:hypothetical protein